MNEKDDHHQSMVRLFMSEQHIAIPVPNMTEIAYLVESRHGTSKMDALLRDIGAGLFKLVWHLEDLPRIRELATKYGDLPLGFADATVIATAERYGGRVATADRRHFEVVKPKRELTLLPLDIPYKRK